MSTERPTHDESDDGARDETAREAVGRKDPARDGTDRSGAPEAHATHHAARPGGDRPAGADEETVTLGRGGAGRQGADPADPAGPEATEEAAEGPGRWRRSPLAVASVALAVLLAGGGGAYVAANASGGKDSGAASGDGNPPPLALDDRPQGARASGEDHGGPGIAPGEPDPNGTHATVYRATGALPDGPAEAAVYRSTGSVTAAQVNRLAKALGVTGTPRLTAGSWQVGPEAAGSGPSLQVTRQAPGSWTFSRNAPGGDDCPRGKECSTGSAVDGGGGTAVSEQAAKAAAAPVLKALGQDDAKLDAGQLMGAVRVVNADPEVGGLPTFGWSTGIRIGADGSVVGGNGRMLTPAKGETYPVLSAERTLDLLNKSDYGRMMPKACPGAVPDARQDGDGSRSQGASCAEPGAARGKSTVVPVRSAVFGLATHVVAGRPALVPSWLFEAVPQGAKTGYTQTYPAVDPRFLADGDSGAGRGTTPPTTPDDPRHVHITSYTADGRSLTVHFYGGVCSDYTAAADETADKVTVTVTEHKKDPGKACIMIAKEFTRTVQLDRAVDDRKVVDSTDSAVHLD